MTITTRTLAPWATPGMVLDTYSDSWLTQFQAASTGQAWGTANRAIFVPLRVPSRCVVLELAYGSGTTGAGNIDIGLYDAGGTRLVSTGSTAKPATQGLISLDVTDTTIGPGLYYLALNNSTTTDTFSAQVPAAPNLAARGVVTPDTPAGAVTLPASVTYAVDQTLALCPVMAVALITELAAT